MELYLLNRINCLLFPNDETRSLFGLCYRINKKIKNLCLAGNKILLESLCRLLEIQRSSSFFDSYNTVIRKVGDLSFVTCVEYLLFRGLGVPYIEKDNYVIIAAYANSSLIEYFSFSTGKKLKTIDSSHSDISTLLRTNNLLVSCSGCDEIAEDSHINLFDIPTGNQLYSIKLKNCNYIDMLDNFLAISAFDETMLYNIVQNIHYEKLDVGGPVCLTKEKLIGCVSDEIQQDISIFDRNRYDDPSETLIICEESPCRMGVKGDLLFYGCDYDIVLYNLKTRKVEKKLEGHFAQIETMLITENTLISGSIDNTIKFWNISTGKIIKTLHGHENRVMTLALLDNYLISGDWDNKIFIWDLTTDTIIRKINTTAWVNSLIVTNLKYV